MKTFEAQIRLPNSTQWTKVRVQANSSFDARNQLEAQYGKGSIQTGPTEVR